jgi:uncharacterized protein YggE
MRILGAILALAAASSACSVAAQGPPAPERAPTITAAGEGERTARPDQATILIAVQTRDASPVNAGARNAEQMTAVMRALRGVGLDEAEISTAVYSLRQETWRSPTDTVFVAENAVRVETRKLDRLSRILDTAITAGANSIGSLQFGLADPKPLEAEALALAVGNARARAEAMAAAAGGRLGPLEELTSQADGYRPVMDGSVMMARAAEGAPTPVTPRELTVSARVVARWRFVPGR